MNIKKIFLITTLFLSSVIFIFADDLPFVTFSLGLTTGHTFYGQDSYEYTFKIKEETLEPEASENSESSENSEENEPDSVDSVDSAEVAPVEISLTEDNSTEAADENSQEEESDETDINEVEKTVSFPMKFGSGNEILIGTTATINFNVTKYFSAYTDLDFLADLNWEEKNYSHHLDYSAATGVKLYFIPKIPSISVSIAYLFGTRTDFFKNEEASLTKNTPWGNGIKLAAEYNFSREGISRFAPTIGCSWRYIPRGNYLKDNIISAYAQFNF